MIHRIAVFVTALLLSCSAYAAQIAPPPTDPPPTDLVEFVFTQELELAGGCPVVEEAEVDGLVLAQGCCKTCRKGKACGNSCINRGYTCHQPPGCACDG